tara:strand:+ start:3577 stop:4455 length:879 start_codon:yes stop_codon:yes gene_type:complete
MEKQTVIPLSAGVQTQRKSDLMRELSTITASHNRAFEFLSEIIESEPDKIMLDEDCIVVAGHLATYRINIGHLLKRLSNPIVYGLGFDTISVHEKGKLNREKSTYACIQSIAGTNVPFADSIAAMIFGLLNDENFFHSKDGDTLSQALVELYGANPYSPIGGKLKQYIFNKYNANYDPEEMTISFQGTHGYKWRLGFSNPLALGYSLEYKKPRQRLWRILTRDTSSVLSHSNEIFSLLHRILRSPGNVIPESMDWSTSLELCKLILPVVDGFQNFDEDTIRQACINMEYVEW